MSLTDTQHEALTDVVVGDLCGLCNDPRNDECLPSICAARLVAGWLAEARAEAWDEGYSRGVRDEYDDVQHNADNPYRSTP